MTHATGLLYALLVVALIALGAAPFARATVQEEDCIDPAVEYPVPCDEDDGD